MGNCMSHSLRHAESTEESNQVLTAFKSIVEVSDRSDSSNCDVK